MVCSVQGKMYSGQESLPEVLELASKICLKLVLLPCDCMTHTLITANVHRWCVWKSNHIVYSSSLYIAVSESSG